MTQILALCFGVIVGLVMTINAAFMLASPRRWLRLPVWLRMAGTFIEDKYGSGWGAIHIRLTGALILAVIAWVLYDFFLRR